MVSKRAATLVVCALAFSAALAGQETAAVFQGDAAEQFLAKARLVRFQGISQGVTAPRKATLQLNGITRSAAFKTVDIEAPGVYPLGNGQVEYNFTDSWRSEVAAYMVDRIIGLELVPATIQRTLDGKEGSLQWWVESEMSEADRLKNRVQPPDAEAWSRQQMEMALFDNLIYNTDRHHANILITKTFELRLIDHSRSFRTFPELKPNHGLTRFSRKLLAGLAKLERNDLRRRIGKWVPPNRIDAMLKRRDLILDLAKKLVAEKGEAAVLY